MFSKKVGKPITSISPGVMRPLQSYSWPGNIRELCNVIERAVVSSHGSVLRWSETLDTTLQEEAVTGDHKTLEQVDREYIIRILEEVAWRIEGPTGAARVLGLNPSTLRTRMVRLGIQRRTGS
jgi:transcriptional regulator with GAF, ATPase, and Fis domain